MQGHLLKENNGKQSRNRKFTLSDSEVITILILFHLKQFRTLKAFYTQYIQVHCKDNFPHTVSYSRFVELQQKTVMKMTLFLQLCCMGKCTGISFIDSTPLRVCHIRREHSHKTFKGIASKGKSTMGWFFGFKLHIVINDRGEISQELFEKLFIDGIHLITRLKKNMKNSLMFTRDKICLRKRALIETVNDELKNMCQIEHTRHRCFVNFTSNMVDAIIAYNFLPKKPSLNLDIVDMSTVQKSA
jgi:hypothetical protein